MRQCSWGWYTGMTQRDGMEREVGGGSGWGTHVHLWQIHVNVWQNQKKKKRSERALFVNGRVGLRI